MVVERDARDAVLGVFVGGASRRMGGRPKGLLPAPDTGEPLVARLVRLGREAGFGETVLVGDATPYRAVVPAACVALRDEPAGIGPLGGLAALLAHAGPRAVVAVACDAPFVSAALLARLAVARGTSAQRSDDDDDDDEPPVLCARAPDAPPDAPLEPLLARYDAPRVRLVLAAALADGERSFQGLLRRLRVATLELLPAEARALRDWDTPDDVRASSEPADGPDVAQGARGPKRVD